MTFPAGPPISSNPLSSDRMLFDMYMSALDVVLAEPEIRSASDELDLSAAALRMRMVNDASRILESAPREYAAYRNVVAREFTNARQITSGSRRELEGVIRLIWIGVAVTGALMVVAGASSIAVWPWTEPLVWAGATMLTVAGGLWLIPSILDIGVSSSGELFSGSSSDLTEARDRLMAAVSKTELVAQTRTLINSARQGRFGHEFIVAGTPGLSEVYDRANKVPTEIATELDGLLSRLDGASIGVAGPRGSGKSTLIREYCEEPAPASDRKQFKLATLLDPSFSERPGGDLKCLVAAPVDYVARDFVLYLFAAFCRAVIGRYSGKASTSAGSLLNILSFGIIWRQVVYLLWETILFGGTAAALMYWKHPIARRTSVPTTWVTYAAIAVICAGIVVLLSSSTITIKRQAGRTRADSGRSLIAAARVHLSRVRYLQTYTSGWSGTLSLPGGTQGQHSRGVSRAEQPRSYPEIVEEFRNFARSVAADIYLYGDRVFIGLDELDKIGSAEQAEHFLNEIKGIFGIPHLYFMVSVSDDALTAFERRGLPLRDAFDSSFDEIIQVGPLSYLESRKLLYRRVIGLTEPYVALCHCLAGGLARDLIRAARQVVRAAANLTPTGPSATAAEIAKNDHVNASTADPPPDEPVRQAPMLAAVATAIVREELRRKVRAVSHVLGKVAPGEGTELQDTLYDIGRQLAVGKSAISIVDLVAKPYQDEPPAVVSLRLDLAAYAYYCATLQDIFADKLDSKRMVLATSESASPGSFDALAAARYAFTVDTIVAWRSITQFRKAWSLETREPVTK